MDLVAASPNFEIEFKVSLPQNVFTTMLLLEASGRVEGLGEWINQAVSHLSLELAESLRRFAQVTGYCTGFWGALVTAEFSERIDTFEDLRAHLVQVQPAEYQRAAREGVARRLQAWGLALPGEILSADEPDLLPRMVRIWEERQVRSDGGNAETLDDVHELVALINRPAKLKALVLDTLTAIWENVYRERYTQDVVKVRQAVAYHRAQKYPPEFRAAFVAITGRTVPAALQNRLEGVRRIIMTPVRHVGPYLVFSQHDDTLFIAFNADTAPSRPVVRDQGTVLYPPLKALADETRLQIIGLLGDGERFVGEIADLLGLSHSSASRHLNLLTTAEILEMRKENNMRYYRLNLQQGRYVIANLQELFHL